MTRLRTRLTFSLSLDEERIEDIDDADPPSRPFADAEAEGEEVSGLRPALALKPIAKATSRLAEIVPLFRKAVG